MSDISNKTLPDSNLQFYGARLGRAMRASMVNATIASMSNLPLQAPWRMDYILSLEQLESGCFLCAAAAASDPADLRSRLVLKTTPHSVMMINRFPYTNGHLLVAPRSHKADFTAMSPEEIADVQQQTIAAIELLKRALSPQGFNIGINLGRCAGAGLPGHLHQHVVPRWGGDTNFMTVVGDIRVVPDAMDRLWLQLRQAMAT